MEVAAFWIGLAAVIIAGGWYKSRIEAQKHQTFRTIVEKTGNVDEAQLRLLMAAPRPKAVWESNRGDSYRFLRGGGAILMFLGGGGLLFGGALLLALIFFGPSPSGNDDGPGIFMALGFAALILGSGMFYSSRYAEKPAADSERPGGRSHNE